jgi:hypothetical protein
MNYRDKCLRATTWRWRMHNGILLPSSLVTNQCLVDFIFDQKMPILLFWPYRNPINFTWCSLHFLFKNIIKKKKKKKKKMLLRIVWRSSWASSHSWVVSDWLNVLVSLSMLSWLLSWNSVIESWRFAWGLSRRSFSGYNWLWSFEDDAIYALVKVDWVGLEFWLRLILMLHVFVVWWFVGLYRSHRLS